MRWVLRSIGILAAVVVIVSAIVLAVLSSRGEKFLLNRLGTLEITTCSPISESKLYYINSIILKDNRGLEVRGFLRIPRGEGPYPVVVLLAGLNTGRESLDWVMDVPETRSVAFFTLDYPYQGKTHFQNLEFLQNLGSIYQALFDGVNAGIYARRYLEEIPQIDHNRIFIVGVSFGAFYSVVSGALDTRFRMVGAFFGGADFAELLNHNMARQGILKFTPIRWVASQIAASILRPLEPTHWVKRISPRPFLMINGNQDVSIPKQNVMELFESANDPKKLIWINSMHIDLEGPKVVPELVRQSALYLNSLGLLESIEN
jgi:dipeptidyl aminopeptidase/acylaminoacyl peptidase